MHRCYVSSADFSQPTISILDSNEVHHLKDVLRLKKGDAIEVFNAQSQMADIILEIVNDEEVVGRVKAVRDMVVDGVKIILACAIPKGAKFEDIIEKATELGVDEIIPLVTARTEVIYQEDKAREKLVRFTKIVVSAAKQCGRGQLPKIHPFMSLAKAFEVIPQGAVKLFPSLHGHTLHIRKALANVPRTGTVAIFIGPEGDFTSQEVAAAIKAGCQPVTLGTTVLRVDTAAISSVGLVRYLLRD